MKIKMKDSGESPEFGPYESGMVFDEARVCPETMQILVTRGIADWVTVKTKKEVTDNV